MERSLSKLPRPVRPSAVLDLESERAAAEAVARLDATLPLSEGTRKEEVRAAAAKARGRESEEKALARPTARPPLCLSVWPPVGGRGAATACGCLTTGRHVVRVRGGGRRCVHNFNIVWLKCIAPNHFDRIYNMVL